MATSLGNLGSISERPVVEFRSIETVDPTTVRVYPDRLVVGRGAADGARVVPLEDVTRIKVRTLLGVSTILIRTNAGSTVVADLFAREEAAAAKALLDELLSGSAPTSRAPAA